MTSRDEQQEEIRLALMDAMVGLERLRRRGWHWTLEAVSDSLAKEWAVTIFDVTLQAADDDDGTQIMADGNVLAEAIQNAIRQAENDS